MPAIKPVTHQGDKEVALFHRDVASLGLSLPVLFKPEVDDFRGFWFVANASNGSNAREHWDATATDHSDWDTNWKNTAWFAVNHHVHTASAPTDSGLVGGDITLPVPLPGLEFYLTVYNGTWRETRADFDLEFLDADGNIVAVMRALRDGQYRHKLHYGPDWETLTQAPHVGSITLTTGYLRFDDTGFNYVHRAGVWPTQNSYNDSFRCDADMTQVTTMRFKNVRVYQDYSGATAYITLALLGRNRFYVSTDPTSTTVIPYHYVYEVDNTVYLYNSETDTTTPFPVTFTRVDAVELDYFHNRLFVTGDMNGGYPRFLVFDLDGTVIYQQGGSPWAFRLDIDRAQQHVYVCDAINNIDAVRRFNYQGGVVDAVFTWGGGNVTRFAIDKVNRYIFCYHDSGKNILKLSLNSPSGTYISNATSILTLNGERQFGVRPSTATLWFCGDDATTLQTIQYDGTGLTDTGIACDLHSHVYTDANENVYYTLNGTTHQYSSTSQVTEWSTVGHPAKMAVQPTSAA